MEEAVLPQWLPEVHIHLPNLAYTVWQTIVWFSMSLCFVFWFFFLLLNKVSYE